MLTYGELAKRRQQYTTDIGATWPRFSAAAAGQDPRPRYVAAAASDASDGEETFSRPPPTPATPPKPPKHAPRVRPRRRAEPPREPLSLGECARRAGLLAARNVTTTPRRASKDNLTTMPRRASNDSLFRR